jgi:hypothetical protein
LRPQTKPFDGTNDGDAGHRVAVEALGFLGNRYPAAVKAAFEQLLGHAETVGLALLGIKQWADACMLPALAALMHTRPDNVFGYLISNALCSIENHEAIALLEQLMEIYEDDPDLAEHIQEAIYCIED